MDLYEHFSFFSPNYEYSPLYKRKLWDGKIRLFDKDLQYLPYGLLSSFKQYCKENNYSYEYFNEVESPPKKVSKEDIFKFIKKLKLPFKPHAHQLLALYYALNYKRALMLSATSSR